MYDNLTDADISDCIALLKAEWEREFNPAWLIPLTEEESRVLSEQALAALLAIQEQRSDATMQTSKE